MFLFDLSKVMFITQPNVAPVPEPLRDRMEIIELQGYTEDEKVHIAFRYLIPRQIDENGSKQSRSNIRSSVRSSIRHHTREAVSATLNASSERGSKTSATHRRRQQRQTDRYAEIIHDFLGAIKIRVDTEIAERTKRPGVAVGWLGHPLARHPLYRSQQDEGQRRLHMTGQLGQVMQESMQAALTWVRSNAALLNISDDFFSSHDLHIHVPAGAIPKDGLPPASP